LAAVLTYVSGVDLSADVRATSDGNDVFLGKEGQDLDDVAANTSVQVALAPLETTTIPIRVKARGAVRRGKVGLVVTAIVHGSSPGDSSVVATRELDVETSAGDVLPAALGVGTVLLVPGLIAVWTWLKVGQWDRRRIGMDVPDPAKVVWDNKLWLLAAAAASVLAALAYRGLGQPDLFDAFRLSDVGIVTVGAGGVAACLSLVGVVWHRSRVPVINSRSSEAEVLAAAAKSGSSVNRRTYKTDDEVGLLIHVDRGVLVLSPPIKYSLPDSVAQAVDRNDLPSAASAASGTEFNGIFRQAAGDVKSPVAVSAATQVGNAKLLVYADPPDE
jgi:hypothetical protein